MTARMVVGVLGLAGPVFPAANVVTPVGGASSYYTDWVRDDAALGRNRWGPSPNASAR
ncbi:hypothetical protein [Nocardia sp. SSK8]|uniref:hypothetical protein n=1 Tax=Nocardia sp. SSK8 TaxID=3120154 RepID=UPI003009D575